MLFYFISNVYLYTVYLPQLSLPAASYWDTVISTGMRVETPAC